MNKAIYIFALAAHGRGISGGDRIFIEFARRWGQRYRVHIYLWKEGYKMCKRNRLEANYLEYHVSGMGPWRKFGFIINYIARIFEGIRLGLVVKVSNDSNTIIYSASEFWMDSMPALILKLRYPKIIWAAAWYQTAPKPWIGFVEGEREKAYKLSAFLYWLVQQPIKPIISRFADFVLVNNEEEKKQFPNHAKRGKAIVVLGAVPVEEINKYLSNHQPRSTAKYDAVFQGRFHPQKGVVELIEVWKKVVDEKPGAKLAMIGDGPLMKNVKLKVKNLKLRKNVKLFGYVFDGPQKYEVFSQSKVVVHPAFYDSGGMAAAEAMAFGLPCIGFNLKAYKSYYPKGMVKVKIGDLDIFAKTIVDLLKNNKIRKKIGVKAQEMVHKRYSWDVRAEEVYKATTS